MTLPERIISARKIKNWTKKDLANALSINDKNVYRWEAGENIPNIEMAVRIAKTLEVSLDYLGGMENGSNSEPLVNLLAKKMDQLTNDQKIALEVIISSL